MFLTGIADFYIDYDVTRTLAYGFSVDTKTLGELVAGAINNVAGIVETILGIF